MLHLHTFILLLRSFTLMTQVLLFGAADVTQMFFPKEHDNSARGEHRREENVHRAGCPAQWDRVKWAFGEVKQRGRKRCHGLNHQTEVCFVCLSAGWNSEEASLASDVSPSVAGSRSDREAEACVRRRARAPTLVVFSKLYFRGLEWSQRCCWSSTDGWPSGSTLLFFSAHLLQCSSSSSSLRVQNMAERRLVLDSWQKCFAQTV